jgi:hypothetical protein
MKLSIIVIYCLATTAIHQCDALPGLGSLAGKVADVGKLSGRAGVGIVKKIPDLIPTPENLYQVSKQTLIGLPFELLLSGIDKLCKFARKQCIKIFLSPVDILGSLSLSRMFASCLCLYLHMLFALFIFMSE